MSWRRLRLSVETILRLTPAVLGSARVVASEAAAVHEVLPDPHRVAAATEGFVDHVSEGSQSEALGRPFRP
jgi:hypothetical protein